MHSLKAFVELGRKLRDPGFVPEALKQRAYINNGWFTTENVESAFRNIALMLEEDNLQKWLSVYPKMNNVRTVALLMAGNIPMVGFHDLLCVLISGNKALVKLSSDDKELLPWIVKELGGGYEEQVRYADQKLSGFDAVIATGSNNSSRYFDYYFRKVPHIIRKSRTSIAILSGNESEAQLESLGKDVFTYFGRGCRSVSKLFVPAGYDPDRIFRAFYRYKEVLNNNKYGNNYDYYRACYLMNNEKLLDNNFLLLRETHELHSPPAVLFYEHFVTKEDVLLKIRAIRDELQCIVSGEGWPEGAIPFGSSQSPMPWDYADGVDVMKFLRSI